MVLKEKKKDFVLVSCVGFAFGGFGGTHAEKRGLEFKTAVPQPRSGSAGPFSFPCLVKT
jgi:hypothetical protein